MRKNGHAAPVRIRGFVKWFNNGKGYGFLGRDDGADVFVHYSAIEAEGYRFLKEGEAVEFQIETGPHNKPQATQVVRLNPAAAVMH